jgi:hypothetical protein
MNKIVDKSPRRFFDERFLATTDNFAIEQGKAQRTIEWLNSYATKNNKKLEIKLEGYLLSTTRFGNFEVVSWRGEWSIARDLIIRASKKLNIKVVEGGYHVKGQLLSSLFGISREFAKVYSGGSVIGNLELSTRSGRWIVKGEKLL